MKKLSLVISILLTAFVFSMSFVSGADSNDMSLNVSQTVLTIINRMFPASGIEINTLNAVIRKLAHIFEYSVLAISWFITVKLYRKSYLILVSIGLLIALTDELIQRYATNRGSSLIDALVFDFLPFILISTLLKYINNRKSREEDIVSTNTLARLADNKITAEKAYQKMFLKKEKYRVPFSRRAHFLKLKIQSPSAKGVNTLLKILFLIPFPIGIVRFGLRFVKMDFKEEVGMSKNEILDMISSKGIEINVDTKDGDKIVVKTI